MTFFSVGIFFIVILTFVISQPEISGVDVNSITDGDVVKISGTNFGNTLPDIVLFDDFEIEPGKIKDQEMNPISLDSPKHGNWKEYSNPSSPPILDSTDSHSGKLSFRTYNSQNKENSGLVADLGSEITEIFVSFWLRVPDSTNFPGSSSPNEKPSASGTQLKWVSLDHTEAVDKGDEMSYMYESECWRFRGGDYTPFKCWGDWSYPFYFGIFQRTSFYFKAAPNPTDASGNLWYQFISEKRVYSSEYNDVAFFKSDKPATDRHSWNRITFAKEFAETENCRPILDDIYVAKGENAFARVEIGISQNYQSSQQKILAIQLPTAWTDNEITINVNFGGLPRNETVYLFVVDAQGQTSSGYPIRTALNGFPSDNWIDPAIARNNAIALTTLIVGSAVFTVLLLFVFVFVIILSFLKLAKKTQGTDK